MYRSRRNRRNRWRRRIRCWPDPKTIVSRRASDELGRPFSFNHPDVIIWARCQHGRKQEATAILESNCRRIWAEGEIEYAAGWLRGGRTGENLPINLNRAAQPTRRLFCLPPGSASGKIANLKLKNRFLDMCPGIFPGKSVRTCPGNSVRLWLANGGKIGILAL